MSGFLAFFKKEFLYQLRGLKLLFLFLIFAALGVMNPLTAKLTPMLLELLSDSMAQAGMTLEITTVTALDSWMQFFKNFPMALIAFVLLESNLFTKEYRTGTLILSLTKGLPRYQVVLSKATMLVLLWSIFYGVYFGFSYAGTVLLWDNSVAQHLLFSVVCAYVFGLWLCMLIVLFSSVFTSYIPVLGFTGLCAFLPYMVSMLPKIGKYLPTRLLEGTALVYGLTELKEFTPALIITAVLSLIFLVVAIPIFNKKKL